MARWSNRLERDTRRIVALRRRVVVGLSSTMISTVSESDADKRVDGIASAQRRTHFAFSTVLILSLGMTIIWYNSRRSWYLDTFALPPEKTLGAVLVSSAMGSVSPPPWSLPQLRSPLVPRKFDPDAYTEHLQRALLSEWASSRIYNVPILGVRIGPSDVPVLGSFCMLLAIVWLWHSVRLERILIELLTRSCCNASRLLKQRVFYAILSGMVFGVPIYLPTDEVNDANAPELDYEHRRGIRDRVGQTVYALMNALPFVSLAFFFVDNLVYLKEPSAFRDSGYAPAFVTQYSDAWTALCSSRFTVAGTFILLVGYVSILVVANVRKARNCVEDLGKSLVLSRETTPKNFGNR